MKIIRMSVCIRGKLLRIHNGRFSFKILCIYKLSRNRTFHWNLWEKNLQSFSPICAKLKDLSIEFGLKGFFPVTVNEYFASILRIKRSAFHGTMRYPHIIFSFTIANTQMEFLGMESINVWCVCTFIEEEKVKTRRNGYVQWLDWIATTQRKQQQYVKAFTFQAIKSRNKNDKIMGKRK